MKTSMIFSEFDSNIEGAKIDLGNGIQMEYSYSYEGDGSDANEQGMVKTNRVNLKITKDGLTEINLTFDNSTFVEFRKVQQAIFNNLGREIEKP